MFKKSDFLRAGFNEAWADLMFVRCIEHNNVPEDKIPEFDGSLEELIEWVVNGAFVWADTPEGHLFWSAVDHIVLAGDIDKLMDAFPTPEDVVVKDDLLEMGEKARYKWLHK